MRISQLVLPIFCNVLFCFAYFWVKIWVNDFYSLTLVWYKIQNTRISLPNEIIIINTTKFVQVFRVSIETDGNSEV